MSMRKSKQEKRPSSDNFVDLHIFVVPYELWMEKYRTAYNSSTLESISAGFVRVPPLLTLEDLRIQIKEQLSGGDILPEEYVFLRCVGRCLAIVSTAQELSLKVKHFLPPVVSLPEIFVLFGNHESLAFSINTASDLPDFGTVRGYQPDYSTYSREMDDNSKSSSPERGKTEHLDTDTLQRRVHFQQNNDNKEENVEDSKRVTPENFDFVRKVEGKYSAKLPEATKSNPSDQYSRRSSDSRPPDNQKSNNESRRMSSELPMNQNLKDNNQVDPDEVNGLTSRVISGGNTGDSRGTTQGHKGGSMQATTQISSSLDNEGDGQDTTQISSSFENQHKKNPRNKIQRKNPLLHSKTAPSLLQTSLNETNGNQENEQNERKTETRSENEENDGILNKREGKDNRSSEFSDHVNDENDSEVGDKTREGDELHAGLDSEGIKNNFQEKLVSALSDGYEEPRVVDSTTKENIKHSAENSVASSGFESLNQSNNNRHSIERNENDFGVTISDKENLVLQLQGELNAVRSERSNSEKTREQLLKKAKNLQNQNNQKRIQAKSVWKKRYFEEKKKTASFEERCNQLRYEVELIHKKLLSSVDAKDRDSTSGYVHKDGDPKKLNAKIMLARKENDVEELRRRVEEAKIKLGSEMKLRDTAQKELKNIRDEVIDKKINATLVKKSLSLLETRSPNDT